MRCCQLILLLPQKDAVIDSSVGLDYFPWNVAALGNSPREKRPWENCL